MKKNATIILSTFIKQNIAVCLLLTLFSVQAFAQPKQIHLSFAETDSKNRSNINVVWCNTHDAVPQFVVYGKSSDLKKTASPAISELDGNPVYKATLKKLAPSTRYYYKCGSDKTGWSATNSFITAPKKGAQKSFSVGIYGDTQNNEFNEQFQKTAEVVKQLSAHNPDLTLHMGDIVNNGSVNNDWLSFLEVSRPLITKSPFMAALGNHDIENSTTAGFQMPFPSFYSLFAFPGNGLDYSFNYGNAHFVCIFSGLPNLASENGKLRYGVGSNERLWLENDLRAAQDDPKTDWIIVYMHHPVHSFGWSNIKKWKETMSPLLGKYKVDLSLAGHRHVFERHHPLKNDELVDKGNGTVFITNGTGGGSPQGPGGTELATMAFTPKERMYNYALMTIDGKSLKYSVFNLEGVKIDEFELTK